MKVGDLVRFRAPHWLGGAGVSEDQCPSLIGLLVEHHVWEKMTTVLYKGQVIRLQSRRVEKAGKKDCESR